MKNYISISKVKAMTVKRMSTGQEELDWLYGLSRFPDGDVWGMPVGTISTWVGEGGVGKSRLAINIAKNKVAEGKTVLYLQNEVDLPTLAGWVNDNSLTHFYCSEVTALSDQTEAVRQLQPDIVFVDSINLINEFGTGTAKSIKKIIDGFRAAIKGTKCHVIILCQLNKEGSATGSTALGHLPDININLTNTERDGIFRLTIGKKHRYGRKGKAYTGLWEHIETGVKCISNNRMQDERWAGIISSPANDVVVGAIPILDSEYVPIPLLGPQLVKNNLPRTLEDATPAVREAYYRLNPGQKPTLINKVLQIYKKNWSK